MLQGGDQEAELGEAGWAFSPHALSMVLCCLSSGRQGLVLGREATIKTTPGALPVSTPTAQPAGGALELAKPQTGLSPSITAPREQRRPWGPAQL